MHRLHTASRAFNLAAALAVVLFLAGAVSGTVRLNSSTRPLLPKGSAAAGREGAEESALRLARALDAVPESPESTCPDDRLEVSWTEPTGNYQVGSYFTPVGPPPGPATQSVNGVVLCSGSDYGFMGFEAHWEDERWVVFPVPDLGEGEGGGSGVIGDPLPAGLSTLDARSPWHGLWGPEIEPLSSYEPQQKCSPQPKRGTAAFARLVREGYPGTRSYGVSRACDDGPRSEHKEGRAWDWGVSVDRPAENRAANELIAWLLATDEHGNQFAMARRLGVMYIIWDRHIWTAYRADAGWRPYGGSSPHTDHVHISFNRDGGDGDTSFWTVPAVAWLLGEGLLGGFPPGFPGGFDTGGRLVRELGLDAGVPPGSAVGDAGSRSGPVVADVIDRPVPDRAPLPAGETPSSSLPVFGEDPGQPGLGGTGDGTAVGAGDGSGSATTGPGGGPLPTQPGGQPAPTLPGLTTPTASTGTTRPPTTIGTTSTAPTVTAPSVTATAPQVTTTTRPPTTVTLPPLSTTLPKVTVTVPPLPTTTRPPTTTTTRPPSTTTSRVTVTVQVTTTIQLTTTSLSTSLTTLPPLSPPNLLGAPR